MTGPSPSIADLLEATSRELAGTHARVYRRVGTNLQRTAQAARDQGLQQVQETRPRPAPRAAWGGTTTAAVGELQQKRADWASAAAHWDTDITRLLAEQLKQPLSESIQLP
jgi:hypothetical protein